MHPTSLEGSLAHAACVVCIVAGCIIVPNVRRKSSGPCAGVDDALPNRQRSANDPRRNCTVVPPCSCRGLNVYRHQNGFQCSLNSVPVPTGPAGRVLPHPLRARRPDDVCRENSCPPGVQNESLLSRSRARSVSRKSVERFHLHEPVVVIAADPERHRSRRIVDEYRPHVRVGWHEVLHRGASLWIEPHDAVGVHGGSLQANAQLQEWRTRQSDHVSHRQKPCGGGPSQDRVLFRGQELACTKRNRYARTAAQGHRPVPAMPSAAFSVGRRRRAWRVSATNTSSRRCTVLPPMSELTTAIC